MQDTILNVFEHENLQELYDTQRQRIIPLVDICDDIELKSVLQAFAREYTDSAEWVSGIAGIVVKKPMDSWSDKDFTLFATKLRDYADRIQQLETLASVNGQLIAENTRLLSVMTPDGVVKRFSKRQIPVIRNTGHSQTNYGIARGKIQGGCCCSGGENI